VQKSQQELAADNRRKQGGIFDGLIEDHTNVIGAGRNTGAIGRFDGHNLRWCGVAFGAGGIVGRGTGCNDQQGENQKQNVLHIKTSHQELLHIVIQKELCSRL